MKEKLKYFFSGLMDVAFSAISLSSGISSIILSFSALKAWVAILFFVIGAWMTAVGTATIYSHGKNIYRLEELEKKEKARINGKEGKS